MLKFLFGTRNAKSDAAPESMRTAITRLQDDLNAVLETLPEKPKVTLDPATGAITFDLPEQLPDEALALPAPGDDAEKEAA